MKNFIFKTILLIAFILVPVGYIHAEENNTLSESMESFDFDTVSQQQAETEVHEQSDANTLQLALISNNQHYVLTTAALFAFTLLIITFLMRITPHEPKDIVTIVGLVSVIFGTILLVLVVDTTETLTAPMGILGAIAGYLFGSVQRKDSAEG